MNRPVLTVSVVAAMVSLLLSGVSAALAHCDTMNGPVVLAARQALAKGDATPALKWVAPEGGRGEGGI